MIKEITHEKMGRPNPNEGVKSKTTEVCWETKEFRPKTAIQRL
jgi:hypothetical protein